MKWGILATGTIARKFAATVNQMKDPKERLAAVGSRNPEKAKAFAEEYGIPAFYDSYAKLVQDPEVEAVYVATPNSMHYEDCLMCLNAGKHVLCEKPFTVNADQARILYRTAEEKGLFIMEAFWIRFLPLYEALGRLLGSGRLGRVHHVRCEYGFIARGARKDRKFDLSLGGGALLDIGIYNLGFLHMIMGCAPESFTSQVHLNEYGTDDYSVLQLAYPDGRTAHSLQTIGLQLERQAAVFCEEGTVYLEDFQHAVTMRIVPVEGEPWQETYPCDVNGFEYQIRETSRCIAQGFTCSPVYTPSDSLTVLQLMDDIRASWNLRFEADRYSDPHKMI